MINMENFSGLPNDGRVRLIEQINEEAAFYVCDDDPIYATTAIDPRSRSQEKETVFLKLLIGAKLKPISADGEEIAEEPQKFDIIRLINWQEADGKARIFETFIELCEIHANQQSNLSFEDYFYSLTELFQPNKEQSKLNAYGLYCELAFIDNVTAQSTVPDITGFWQIDGTNSKYDFVLPRGNAEVKSCTKNHEVPIKHDQLFNDDCNYLVAVSVERNPSGETLISLINRLIERDNCFTTLHSRLELSKRTLQINEKDLNKRIRVRYIRCYPAALINMFDAVPDRVTELTYKLNLTDMNFIDADELVTTLI